MDGGETENPSTEGGGWVRGKKKEKGSVNWAKKGVLRGGYHHTRGGLAARRAREVYAMEVQSPLFNGT